MSVLSRESCRQGEYIKADTELGFECKKKMTEWLSKVVLGIQNNKKGAGLGNTLRYETHF